MTTGSWVGSMASELLILSLLPLANGYDCHRDHGIQIGFNGIAVAAFLADLSGLTGTFAFGDHGIQVGFNGIGFVASSCCSLMFFFDPSGFSGTRLASLTRTKVHRLASYARACLGCQCVASDFPELSRRLPHGRVFIDSSGMPINFLASH